ncbi:MAG: hypothetical protein O2871_04220, partial [bacterium]|nr:hypothetical protein [bacterium]
MTGLIGAMETGLTLTDLLKDELNGAEFNKENIRAILNDEDAISRIQSKSLARGLTIGMVEGLTMGLSRGVGGKILKESLETGTTGLKTGAKIAATTSGIEATGGFTGEVGGQVASGKEIDLGEATLEAIGELKGVVNVSDIIAKTLNKSEYKINGEIRTKEEIRNLISNPNTTKADLAKIRFEVKNDNDFNSFVEKNQNNAIIDSQIDTKVTDSKDRETLVELELSRIKAESDLKKKGINKVPNAPEALATIEAEIDAIIGKYDSAKGIGKTELAQSTAKVVRENRISQTIAFAETEGKKIGKSVKVVNNDNEAQAAYDKMAAEGNLVAKDVTGADGYIVGDVIIINKEVAGSTGAINVGGHEILHGVLAKHMQGLDVAGKKALISSFKGVLSKNQLAAVTERLQENYSDQIAEDSDFINTTDEWFTAFSDAIEQGDITFDEGVFSQLKNTIQEILRKFGIKKDFADGRQAYNFLKDYSKSIKNNKLSSRALALADSGTTTTDTKAITTDTKAKTTDTKATTADTKTIATTKKDKTVLGERKVNHTATDSEGNTYTYFADTTEKNGLTTTRFTFNRSDRLPTQRNTGGVPVQVALGDKYTIDPADLDEGVEITQVLEIREGETGAAATVRYRDADGNGFNGEVVLVPTTGKKAGDAKFSRSTVNLDEGKGELHEKIDALTNNAKTKAEFQERTKENGRFSAFENVYTGILDGKFDRIFGKNIDESIKEKQRENLADRLWKNYDPKLTPELSKWMYGGSGKAGNIRYSGLTALHKQWKEDQNKNKLTSIDTEEAKDVVDMTTPAPDADTKANKPDTKDVKLRDLKDFDVYLDDTFGNELAIAEVNGILDRYQ